MAELDLDALMEDTKRTARIDDRAAHSTALALIEIAKQLRQINAKLDNGKKSESKKK
jgi:hypothetical protein